MIAGLFFVSAMVVLSLTIYQSASLNSSLHEMFLINRPFQQHRNILLTLFTFMILASQGFIHAQFIQSWFICMKPMSVATTTFNLFWRHPGPRAPKHHKALWVASIGSIVFSLYSLGTTIFVCIRPCLWVQFTTVCTLTRTISQSLICFIAPSCHTKSAEGCDIDMCFLGLRKDVTVTELNDSTYFFKKIVMRNDSLSLKKIVMSFFHQWNVSFVETISTHLKVLNIAVDEDTLRLTSDRLTIYHYPPVCAAFSFLLPLRSI